MHMSPAMQHDTCPQRRAIHGEALMRLQAHGCQMERALQDGSSKIRNKGREIWTPKLLIWSQTRYCGVVPPMVFEFHRFFSNLALT